MLSPFLSLPRGRANFTLVVTFIQVGKLFIAAFVGCGLVRSHLRSSGGTGDWRQTCSSSGKHQEDILMSKRFPRFQRFLNPGPETWKPGTLIGNLCKILNGDDGWVPSSYLRWIADPTGLSVQELWSSNKNLTPT